MIFHKKLSEYKPGVLTEYGVISGYPYVSSNGSWMIKIDNLDFFLLNRGKKGSFIIKIL